MRYAIITFVFLAGVTFAGGVFGVCYAPNYEEADTYHVIALYGGSMELGCDSQDIGVAYNIGDLRGGYYTIVCEIYDGDGCLLDSDSLDRTIPEYGAIQVDWHF